MASLAFWRDISVRKAIFRKYIYNSFLKDKKPQSQNVCVCLCVCVLHVFMTESEEELRSLLMKVKEES